MSNMNTTEDILMPEVQSEEQISDEIQIMDEEILTNETSAETDKNTVEKIVEKTEEKTPKGKKSTKSTKTAKESSVMKEDAAMKPTVVEIDDIPGVGPATADRLREAGYITVESLATAVAADLSEAADIGEGTAKKIIRAAGELADIGGFKTGTDILLKRKEVLKLSTLVPEFDEMLDGGLETQAITEIYGEFGSGKSQIVHQMAVNCQLPAELGGLGGSCLYIDTENTFRPERIEQMVQGLEFDELPDDYEIPSVDEFLANIHVARAHSSDHQMLLVDAARDLACTMSQSGKPVKLVIVDSLTGLFRAEYSGRGTLAGRQQKLNRHMHDLFKLVNDLNAVAIVTNQVMANPAAMFGDPTRPIGGNIVGHTATFRLYLRKSKGGKRIARLVDSPNLPEGEAAFSVEMGGIKEV